MRVLLFTGKGGVGKTTVAAATAVRAAEAGLRTLVMSTDPAHSLGDSFELPIGSDPTEIAAGLWAQQIDAQERLEDNWREIQDYMVQVMNWAGTETIQAEELTVIPGIDEIFALIDVKTHVESGAYDVVLVTRYLHRPLMPHLRRWLAPGGVLIYETFLREQARHGHPKNPDFLLEPGELATLVTPLEIVRQSEGERDRQWIAAIAARRDR